MTRHISTVTMIQQTAISVKKLIIHNNFNNFQEDQKTAQNQSPVVKVAYKLQTRKHYTICLWLS